MAAGFRWGRGGGAADDVPRSVAYTGGATFQWGRSHDAADDSFSPATWRGVLCFNGAAATTLRMTAISTPIYEVTLFQWGRSHDAADDSLVRGMDVTITGFQWGRSHDAADDVFDMGGKFLTQGFNGAAATTLRMT